MSNVIENDAGELFGFYSDLIENLKSEIIRLLQEEKGAPDPGVLANYSEIIEELTKLQEYDGIIKISDNNGMGWTVTKYQYKEN